MGMLIKLIENDKDWVKGKHVWYHPSGVSIWVANLHIGLSAKWDAKDETDYYSLSDDLGDRMNTREWKTARISMNLTSSEKLLAVAKKIEEMYGPK